MSKIDTTVLHDGQLAVATIPQTGTIVSDNGAVDTTAVVQTSDGPQLCVKTVDLNGGGGGGGGGGADTSLSNLTNAGKIQIASLSAPSDTYDDLTLGASGDTYTMPSDGYICLWMAMTGAYSNIAIINSATGRSQCQYASGSLWLSATMAVHKGEELVIYYGAAGSATKECFRFYYAKGSESEKGA